MKLSNFKILKSRNTTLSYKNSYVFIEDGIKKTTNTFLADKVYDMDKFNKYVLFSITYNTAYPEILTSGILDTGELFCVEEYKDDLVSLKEYSDYDGLSEKDKIRFVETMIENLGYLHTHNLVHGNISKENILIDKQLNIYYTDIDILKETECDQQQDRETLGKIIYKFLTGISAINFDLPEYKALPEEIRKLLEALLEIEKKAKDIEAEVIKFKGFEGTKFKISELKDIFNKKLSYEKLNEEQEDIFQFLKSKKIDQIVEEQYKKLQKDYLHLNYIIKISEALNEGSTEFEAYSKILKVLVLLENIDDYFLPPSLQKNTDEYFDFLLNQKRILRLSEFDDYYLPIDLIERKKMITVHGYEIFIEFIDNIKSDLVPKKWFDTLQKKYYLPDKIREIEKLETKHYLKNIESLKVMKNKGLLILSDDHRGIKHLKKKINVKRVSLNEFVYYSCFVKNRYERKVRWQAGSLLKYMKRNKNEKDILHFIGNYRDSSSFDKSVILEIEKVNEKIEDNIVKNAPLKPFFENTSEIFIRSLFSKKIKDNFILLLFALLISLAFASIVPVIQSFTVFLSIFKTTLLITGIACIISIAAAMIKSDDWYDYLSYTFYPGILLSYLISSIQSVLAHNNSFIIAFVAALLFQLLLLYPLIKHKYPDHLKVLNDRKRAEFIIVPLKKLVFIKNYTMLMNFLQDVLFVGIIGFIISLAVSAIILSFNYSSEFFLWLIIGLLSTTAVAVIFAVAQKRFYPITFYIGAPLSVIAGFIASSSQNTKLFWTNTTTGLLLAITGGLLLYKIIKRIIRKKLNNLQLKHLNRKIKEYYE